MTVIFFTRVATVDVVLRKDTRIVPRDNQLWAIQCTWSIVATITIEFAAKAGKIAWTSDKCCMQQKGIVPSLSNFPALVATIVVSSYSGLKG